MPNLVVQSNCVLAKCPGCNKGKKHQNPRDFSPFLRIQINHLRQVERKKRMKNIGGNCKSKQTASEQKWNAKRKDFRIKRVTFVIISTARGGKPVFRRATELNVMRRKHSMRCTLWHLSDQANEPSVHSAGLLASCDLSDGCNTLLLLTCEHEPGSFTRITTDHTDVVHNSVIIPLYRFTFLYFYPLISFLLNIILCIPNERAVTLFYFLIIWCAT